jgi:hypothetical protein
MDQSLKKSKNKLKKVPPKEDCGCEIKVGLLAHISSELEVVEDTPDVHCLADVGQGKVHDPDLSLKVHNSYCLLDFRKAGKL